MHRLWSVSLLMVAVGLVLCLAGVALGLGPVWTLAGLLLAWAGLVKLVVVHLWRGVANPERAAHHPADEV